MTQPTTNKLTLHVGDITEQETDAIINSANQTLMGGSGVDAAIHRKGGSAIQQECIKIINNQYPKGLPIGHAVTTTAGKLKTKHIIHTVGPIWRGGNYGEPTLLVEAYTNSLKQATLHQLDTIATPSISTGAYGYPHKQAAKIAIQTITKYLKNHSKPTHVKLFIPSEETVKIYLEEFTQLQLRLEDRSGPQDKD